MSSINSSNMSEPENIETIKTNSKMQKLLNSKWYLAATVTINCAYIVLRFLEALSDAKSDGRANYLCLPMAVDLLLKISVIFGSSTSKRKNDETLNTDKSFGEIFVPKEKMSGNEIPVSRENLILDIVLTILLGALILVEQNATKNLQIILVTQSYLKIPFTYLLILHHSKAYIQKKVNKQYP